MFSLLHLVYPPPPPSPLKLTVLAVSDRIHLTCFVLFLRYIGWSQGVTQLFIAGIRPETKQFLKDRINLAIAVSPVSFLKYSTSTLINLM